MSVSQLYPKQWPSTEQLFAGEFPTNVFKDEYGRTIYEWKDGTRYSWQSSADDFLPLLT